MHPPLVGRAAEGSRESPGYADAARGSDPFVASIRAAQWKVITIANEMIEANVRSTASRATAAAVRTFLYGCVLTW